MVCGSVVVAEALKEVGPNSVGALGDERVVGEVVLAVELIEEREAPLRAEGLGNRDHAGKTYRSGRLKALEPEVEGRDLRPVGGLCGRRLRMRRSDRRLKLILADALLLPGVVDEPTPSAIMR